MEKLIVEKERFNRTIFWRDFREVGAACIVAIFFLVTRTRDEVSWPVYPAVFLILCVGGYILWHTRKWKKKEKEFENSLRGELEKRIAQLGHQIQLLSRDVIWGYILPICVAIWLLNWQRIINSEDIESTVGILRAILIPVILGLIVYGINYMAARHLKKDRQKIEEELNALLANPSE